MALDYLKTVYKHESGVLPRDNKTSYGDMSRWMGVMDRPYARPGISVNHFGDGNMSPVFTKKRKPYGQPQAPLPQVTQSQPDMAKDAAIDDTVPVHLRYGKGNGHDDYHKAFRAISNQWPSASYPTFGPPRLRHGRQGGSWRHVTEVTQAGGTRRVFVDGRTTLEDRFRMEQAPGGELILGREGEPPSGGEIDFAGEEAKRTAWMASYRRTKETNPNAKLAMYGSVDTKKAVERNNWLIMR